MYIQRKRLFIHIINSPKFKNTHCISTFRQLWPIWDFKNYEGGFFLNYIIDLKTSMQVRKQRSRNREHFRENYLKLCD